MLHAGRGGIVLMSSGAGLAGSAYNAAYAASKAFELVLGESLWSEWRSRGVDVMSVIGPAIDTPTFRASMPPEAVAAMPPAMSPDDVVEEVLAALGSTPSFVPGAANREGDPRPNVLLSVTQGQGVPTVPDLVPVVKLR